MADMGKHGVLQPDDPESMYVNQQTLMGNAVRNPKLAESEMARGEPVLPEGKQVSDDLKAVAVDNAEGMCSLVEKQVAASDVRSLASQFENKHLQNLTKHELKKPFIGLTDDTRVIGAETSSQPKDAPESVETFTSTKVAHEPKELTFNGCVKCKALSTPCHSCEVKSFGLNRTEHFLYDQNTPANITEKPCQLKSLTNELRHKLETRTAEHQNEQRVEESSTPCVTKTLEQNDTGGMNSAAEITHATENSLEQTIYDSVCERSDSIKDFEIVNSNSTLSPDKSSPSQKSDKSKHSRKMLHGGKDYDWKRKEAKKKSRTLKRSPKSGSSPPYQGIFEDHCEGVIPEADFEDDIMEILNPFTVKKENDGSSISDFSDSSFDSDSDKSDPDMTFRESYSKKPLPPEPAKPKVMRDLRQLKYRGDADDHEDKIELEKVHLKRKRDSPALPEAPSELSQNQIKLRGVLQSLIDSEKNYITSLDRLVKVYRDPIQQQFGIKKAEVLVTFNQVEEIFKIHQMFQIELGEKLANWNIEEKIGNTFHLFSGNMALDIYSEYVNNYEAASEFMKDLSNTKQAFKDFLKEKQMSSPDRLSLPGLMLKPIQRFPQFIMIIKDLLKYTPRDHHDRVPLQEALTGMENVAHQLNERKRQSEQFFHGHQIAAKLTPRVHMEKKMFLIRQDDVDQVSQDSTGQQSVKQRRLFLMNDKLISVFVTQKELNGGVEKYTYKWHQSLSELELTTSAITPNMQTTLHRDNKVILSPKIEQSSEDPYSLAGDLTDMIHDINILAQIQMLVSALRHSYSKLNEDLLHEMMTNLQKDIQGVDYQLQLLNSSSIILLDKQRKKKYVFSAANANIKQGWCIDFLLAKYALDVVNIPSWHKQEFVGHDKSQPALFMKHLSVDMQRMFTKVKCAVRVYFPMRNEASVEHLWVCCSTESFSQVSIVSLHTARPALVESFQATQSEIVCVEMVPGYSYDTTAPTAFAEDTVWMSTTESEVLVFMMSERNSTQHRKPIHVFKQASVVLCIIYVDDKVFCGNRNGDVVVFTRNDFGEWMLTTVLMLGGGSVKSMICVYNTIWVACGPNVHIIDAETNKILDKVTHQQPKPAHFNCLAKAGVGVWASFVGKSNISLYHVETKNHLQDFNIGNAINDFISVHSGNKDSTKSYEVTSLMASLGLLWIGTDIGLILTFPLPRLRDGVPKINQRPSVALHGHNRPVQFIIPVHYGPVSGSPVKRRPSEILKKSKITQSVLQRLPKLDEQFETVRPVSQDSHKYLSLDPAAMCRNSLDVPDVDRNNAGEDLYEDMDTCKPVPSSDEQQADRSSPIYEDMSAYSPQGNKASEMGRAKVSEIDVTKVSEMGRVNVLEMGGAKASEMGRVKVLEMGGAKCPQMGETMDVLNPRIRDVKQFGRKDVDVAGTHGSSDWKECGLYTNSDIPSDLNKGADSPVSRGTFKSLRDRSGSMEHTYFILEKRDAKPDVDNVGSQTQARHSSNVEDVFRPKSSPMMNPTPISFRSELKNKLKNRKVLDDLADRDVTSEEVGRLYGTLMRQQSVSSSQLAYQESSSSPVNLNGPNARDSLYVPMNYKSPITPRKPSYSRDNVKPQKLDSVKQKRQASRMSVNAEQKSPVSNGNKNRVASSFSTGVDTLRKQDSNTILVLTGGDGYKDWKKRQSLQSLRPEEPSLVFWLYKF